MRLIDQQAPDDDKKCVQIGAVSCVLEPILKIPLCSCTQYASTVCEDAARSKCHFGPAIGPFRQEPRACWLQ